MKSYILAIQSYQKDLDIDMGLLWGKSYFIILNGSFLHVLA